MAYCTSTQVGYCLTSQEVTELSKQNGTATAAVITYFCNACSREIASHWQGRYDSVASLAPDDYDTDTDPYPEVSMKTSQLVADALRRRMRREKDEMPGMEHPSIAWAQRVGQGLAKIYGA